MQQCPDSLRQASRGINGAGTATAARVLAEEINEGAASGDRVSESQLRDRVRYNEGALNRENSPNKPAPDEPDLANGHSDTLPNDTPPAPPETPFYHRAQGTGEKDMIRFAKLTYGKLAGEGLAETALFRRGWPLNLRITKTKPVALETASVAAQGWIHTSNGKTTQAPIRTPWICRMRFVGRAMALRGRND